MNSMHNTLRLVSHINGSWLVFNLCRGPSCTHACLPSTGSCQCLSRCHIKMETLLFWGPRSPFSYEIGDPGHLFSMKIGVRGEG